MPITLALALTSLALRQQNAFDERLTVVRAVVRPSGSPDDTADVPMRAVPILHRGDRIGVSFPTLAHTDWQATVAFYYQGDPLRWQNQYNSADWVDLRKGDPNVSLHLTEKSGESPLVILAHEVDSYGDRKSLIGALRAGFPALASAGAQLQSTVHEMTALERVMNALAAQNGVPGTQKIDALNLVAAASDYPLTTTDTSMGPNYWVNFMAALNSARAAGRPLDPSAFGAALGQSLPPLARTVLAAGTQLYNLIRTPQRVATYNFVWMPLYEDGDQYRCVLPPIAENEPAKTVMLSWLPVQNSTDLPSLSLDSARYRFGDTPIDLRLAPACAPLLAKPEARSFRLKVGADGTEYPLKSTGSNLVLDAGSAHALAQEYPGKSVNATVEMQYGLDPVDSTPITFECAQPYTWTCADPKLLDQLESGAATASLVLNPVARAGAVAPPRVVRCELDCGAEKTVGTPEVQPNGSVKINFTSLPKSHGAASVYLYEDGLDKPDTFSCQVFAARPTISKIAVVRGESTCTIEGAGIENITRLDIGGESFVRQAGNAFRTVDGKVAPQSGNATATLSDGRTVVYPVQIVDPTARYDVASQVVNRVPTPGLTLPANLVSADTVIEISVDASRPVLTGTTQYEVRRRMATTDVERGHVPMRAGATATTALYHGPVRDFLPPNSVGKFDLRVVGDAGSSEYIPLSVTVDGKPCDIEIVDLPQITGFEVLPGKWRLYGSNLEFLRSLSAAGQTVPVLRQSDYLEFDGKVPANGEVRLLDSTASVGLSFNGLAWRNPPDFAAFCRVLAH